LNTTPSSAAADHDHTAGYSDAVFGLFWLFGFQFVPLLADLAILEYFGGLT